MYHLVAARELARLEPPPPVLQQLLGGLAGNEDGIDHLLHPAGSPVDNQPLAPSFLAMLHQWARHWSH